MGHVVQVSATDAAGNVSDCSAALIVTIDTTAPAAPTAVSVLPAATTNDPTPAIHGTAEAGSTVQVFLDTASPFCTGTPHDTGSAADFGDDGITLAPALSEGPHTIHVRAVDVAGNQGACSAAVAVTIDLTAPDAPTLDAFAASQDSNPRATGTAEAGSQVRAYLTGGCTGAVVAAGTASQFGNAGLVLGPLAPGAYTASVEAEDAAGNVSGCSTSETFDVEP